MTNLKLKIVESSGHTDFKVVFICFDSWEGEYLEPCESIIGVFHSEDKALSFCAEIKPNFKPNYVLILNELEKLPENFPIPQYVIRRITIK